MIAQMYMPRVPKHVDPLRKVRTVIGRFSSLIASARKGLIDF